MALAPFPAGVSGSDPGVASASPATAVGPEAGRKLDLSGLVAASEPGWASRNMHPLLAELFTSLHQAGVKWCVLRDAEELERFDDGGELDLLLAREDLQRLAEIVRGLGFVAMTGRGYAPHHFFLTYDAESDVWFKLDVLTALLYGRPTKSMRTDLASSCLQHRRIDSAVAALAPADELITLLLHCVLDKAAIGEERGQRLHELAASAGQDPRFEQLLHSHWPEAQAPSVVPLILARDWEALLSQREAVAGMLTAREPWRTRFRQARARLLRKSNGWVGWLRPRAPSVALLAPDGAGKSTLAARLTAAVFLPVREIYMGLYQKGGRPLPLASIPGARFLARLVRQWRRYLAARRHQAKGRLVIFDRYTYDSMLPPRRPLSWPSRFRRWLLAHACPPPDLVLFLDAPGQTLYARKGEHTPEILEQQRQAYLSLRQRVARMIVVDATQSIDSVRREVTSLIWRRYAEMLDGRSRA